MDSSLLAAIQKGKGLKKSPRRPSTVRRFGCQASCVKCDDNGECVPSHAHAM